MQALGTPIDSFKSPPSSLPLPKATLCESQLLNIMDTENYSDKPIKSHGGGGGVGAVDWESIRELDDEENWAERNCVISKHDHQLYSECAQEFVNDIIDKIPTRTDSTDFDNAGDYGAGTYLPPPSPYDEENRETIPLASNIESDHHSPPGTVQPPPVSNYAGNYDYMGEMEDEQFQTTTNQLDMDYLERVSSNNSTNPGAMSALARESLFVKFDPLVGRPSAGKGMMQRQPLPQISANTGDNLLMLDTPPQVPSGSLSHNSHSSSLSATSHQDPDDLQLSSNRNSNPDVSMNSLSAGTPRSVRGSSPHSRTLFDISPAAFNNKQTGNTTTPSTQFHSNTSQHEDELVKVLIYSEADLRQIVQQVRNESEIQNEETVALLKVDHAEDLAKQQRKIDRLVKEVQNLRAHSSMVRMDKLIGTEQNQDYEDLCSKYRETEMELIEAYEQLKVEAKRVEDERDQSLKDFASLERSFTDFHQRYNKSKQLVTSLQTTVSELQEHIRKSDNMIKKLKSQNSQLQDETTMKLQEANETYEQIRKECASEVAVLKANAKKMTVQLASLERQLQQKEQEKAELTQICEDLMKELG